MLRKISSILALSLCVGLILAGFSVAQAKKADGSDEYSMEVAPNKILLDAEDHGGEVTVHVRNLAYSDVDTYTLNLTVEDSYGITPYLTKADNNGDLVAKFRLAEVKELIAAFGEGDTNVELELAGFLVDGEEFEAEGKVMVRY